MDKYWENRWNKTVVDRVEAEKQLGRISLIEMDQLPIPIEQFIEREQNYGIRTQS